MNNITNIFNSVNTNEGSSGLAILGMGITVTGISRLIYNIYQRVKGTNSSDPIVSLKDKVSTESKEAASANWDFKFVLKSFPTNERLALIKAAMKKENFDFNTKDSKGRTFLNAAADMGDTQLLVDLLEMGAMIPSTTKEGVKLGQKLLWYAVNKNDFELVKLLKDHGAQWESPFKEDWVTNLFAAIFSFNGEEVLRRKIFHMAVKHRDSLAVELFKFLFVDGYNIGFLPTIEDQVFLTKKMIEVVQKQEDGVLQWAILYFLSFSKIKNPELQSIVATAAEKQGVFADNLRIHAKNIRLGNKTLEEVLKQRAYERQFTAKLGNFLENLYHKLGG